MFRTEVVKSNNLRKTIAFKISNAAAFILMIGILVVVFLAKDESSAISQWINDNYSSMVRPFVFVIAILIVGFSMYTSSKLKNPKRLGSIEIDENEIKFIENDEVVETTVVSELSSIDFEFFSMRMRGNPVGCMNYLTLNKNGNSKTYEIVVGNSMETASLGEIFSTINSKVKVKVSYSYWLKKIIKDKNFQF